jgi:phospholipid-transporting ATPase
MAPRKIKVGVEGQGPELAGLSNAISTTKYNVGTFLPRFLFEQFRKYWNIYFLVIGSLQQIPNISPTGRWGTIMPLTVVLTVAAIKEIWEDFQRLKQDRKINKRVVQRLAGGQWTDALWQDLHVGDLVKVAKRGPFPADLVLLGSSEDSGIAYIETSNLDGETNLKVSSPPSFHACPPQVRQSLTKTSSLLGSTARPDQAAALSGAVVECEGPNKKLYDFAGSLALPGTSAPMPLGTSQVLLRGSRLMNTEFAIGLVVYSGPQVRPV